MPDLKAPFPYFGGKAKVANKVWREFGDVRNYVEPFCGSCAVLLARPTIKGSEVVNDLNGLLINFWRAVKHEPNKVAKHTDSPSSTLNLKAKHNFVYNKRSDLSEKIGQDPDYYNAKIAGYWVYCQSTMIGKRGIFQEEIGYRKPNCGSGGIGITKSIRRDKVKEVISALSERLRYVNILCGDWEDSLTKSTTIQHKKKPRTTAIFLDPPYPKEEYYEENYEHSSFLYEDVVEWCKENEENEYLRIALCGYTGTGVSSTLNDWTQWNWERQGGYANRTD